MEFKVEGELVMNIYLLYGGKSAEHDISIISAYHIMNEIYYDYYKVQPIFITQEGTWLKGNKIESKENVPSLQELRDTNFPAFDIRELVAENSIVFPVLHGPNGEDGTVQGLLETLNVPSDKILSVSQGFERANGLYSNETLDLTKKVYNVWIVNYEFENTTAKCFIDINSGNIIGGAIQK